MPPAPGKVRPHRGRYRVGYLLEEVSNNATAQMIGCLGPRFQGRESPKTERGHLGGAGVTASATIRLTHVATQTRTYMRPPRRAQPTRRLPRVRREHGLVAHPAPTHTQPRASVSLASSSHASLCLPRPMPQTAPRVSLQRERKPRPRAGAGQHATHAETQIPAGRRRRGTQAVIFAG
jgi:hypothetical protein